MLKQKTVYIADDGTVWDHEFQMKFRDQELKDEKEVREWLEDIGAKPAAATRAFNAIMAFLNTKRDVPKPEPEPNMDR